MRAPSDWRGKGHHMSGCMAAQIRKMKRGAKKGWARKTQTGAQPGLASKQPRARCRSFKGQPSWHEQEDKSEKPLKEEELWNSSKGGEHGRVSHVVAGKDGQGEEKERDLCSYKLGFEGDLQCEDDQLVARRILVLKMLREELQVLRPFVDAHVVAADRRDDRVEMIPCGPMRPQ
ncbi:hypothetical protein GOP47_0013288 [Adiantum capillus-veneris]|uniref:Uncharacterized protein n=1 Tax=Adiantum capillus-veneris TaxID=13818 RepID=A0A9D4UP62_ADICA|nr:hypothetical protein GOP47_0013288 [Adiantum capillus-veneris]